jgi:tetratricopeptide (TPR) repeat protein
MADRPVIFISATSDLRSARDLVGKVLYSMGYEPHWEEIQATTGGEMLDVLREWIGQASLVVQLVGRRYGAEPPHPTAEFGRVSYTQFESLEAERIGKKVVYHFLDDHFPSDAVDAEPAELNSLQAAYRQRLVDANLLRHRIASPGDLELSIRRISDDLAVLRRQAERQQRNQVLTGIAILAGVAAVAILAFTILNHQKRHVANVETKLDRQAGEMEKLREEVAAALSPKPLDAGQIQPAPIPPEILEKAKVLLERGNAEQRALGMIALKEHAEADRIIQKLKNKPGNPIEESFRLFTMEGDNWYQAKKPDKAIEPYEQAMALKPRDLQARKNLVSALNHVELGDVPSNFQRAISIAEDSLQLAECTSAGWAMMQNSLGNAWLHRPTGENVEKAIAAYEEALTVYTKETHPIEWAKVQNNLGVALWVWPNGGRVKNSKKAIAAFEAALIVYTKEAHPAEWARTQCNLGNTWWGLRIENKPENVKKAIAAFEAGLPLYPKEDPILWP